MVDHIMQTVLMSKLVFASVSKSMSDLAKTYKYFRGLESVDVQNFSPSGWFL